MSAAPNAVPGPQKAEIDYDAKLKEFDAHPLFMRDIPADIESNEQLEAIQSLIYDDTPDSQSGFAFFLTGSFLKFIADIYVSLSILFIQISLEGSNRKEMTISEESDTVRLWGSIPRLSTPNRTIRLFWNPST